MRKHFYVVIKCTVPSWSAGLAEGAHEYLLWKHTRAQSLVLLQNYWVIANSRPRPPEDATGGCFGRRASQDGEVLLREGGGVGRSAEGGRVRRSDRRAAEQLSQAPVQY